MRTPDQIREYLRDANLSKVARETGLHYNSILMLRNAESMNPTWRTINALSQYIDERERAARQK